MTIQRIGPGFVVLYRWRLHEDKVESFITAWSAISKRLLEESGSLGSRLHRGQDGILYSYAQWPSEETRRRAFATPALDPSHGVAMRAAIAEELPEVELKSISDFMVLPAQ